MINARVAKEMFDYACNEYEILKSLIKEMATFAAMGDKQITFEKSMTQFDLILQGILLRIAAEDGHLLEEEIQFITKITDYADFIDFINYRHNQNFTWEMLGSLEAEERKDITLKMFVTELNDVIKSFVTPFAVVDALLPKDYCQEITEHMTKICTALALCDNDSQESDDFKKEMLVSIALIQKAIREEWKNIVESIESKNSGNTINKQNTAKNSLKDIYLKKKR